MTDPPRLAERLLECVLPADTRDAWLGDLQQRFGRVRVTSGRLCAAAWYWRQALTLLVRVVPTRAAEALRGTASRSSPRIADKRHRRSIGLDSALGELKCALRTNLRSPGFSLVVVATLAFAIGANILIFSLVNAVLLEPLNFPESNRLYRIYSRVQGADTGLSLPRFQRISNEQDAFVSFGASASETFALTGTSDPQQLIAKRVSASFFDTLKVTPHIGRTFNGADDQIGASRVALLSYRFWIAHFDADEDILEASVELDGEAHEIIGVLPPRLRYPYEGIQVWVTQIEAPPGIPRDAILTGAGYLIVDGRLRPNVSITQARDQLVRLVEGYREAYPENRDADFTIALRSLKEDLVGDLGASYLLLLTAVGFVLLIACANVANLILARLTARRGEIALRTALGASRHAILRQCIVESLTLVVPATALGMVAARFGLLLLPAIADTTQIPRAGQIDIDPMVSLFALGLTLVTASLLGLAPIFQLRRAATADVLKEGTRCSTGGPKRGLLNNSLVVGQVALAIALLVASGLTVRSLSNLWSVELGFEASGLLVGSVSLPSNRYPGHAEQAAYYRDLIAQLESLPTVSHATLAVGLPFSQNFPRTFYAVDGEVIRPLRERDLAGLRTVMPGYFTALGARIAEGRAFEDSDASRAQAQVVIVNETLAGRLSAGSPVVGRQLVFGATNRRLEIVGVVADIRTRGLGEEPGPEVYFPFQNGTNMHVAVRGNVASAPESWIPEVHAVMGAIDADVPFRQPSSMEAMIGSSLSARRLLMTCLTMFGSAAILLSALGIYSVISYIARQRTAEIGIRVALGARASEILTMVLWQGSRMVLLGLGLGLGIVAATWQLVSSLLFEVSPMEGAVIVPVTVIALSLGLASCLPAAWRAAVTNPADVLRGESR